MLFICIIDFIEDWLLRIKRWLMVVKNGDKYFIESIYYIIIGIEIYMDKRNSNWLMLVFCFLL